MKARSLAAALWIPLVLGTIGCACGRWVGSDCPHGYMVDQWPSLADWLDEHGPTGCDPVSCWSTDEPTHHRCAGQQCYHAGCASAVAEPSPDEL